MSGNRLGGVTQGQYLALVVLDQGQCEATSYLNEAGHVNRRSVAVLVAAGWAERVDTLIGQAYVITEAGRKQLAVAYDSRMRSAARAVPRLKYRAKQQPLGSLCQHCHYKPARASKRYPHLATNYCSDECKTNESHARTGQAAAAIANEVREMLGMPADRGKHFTTRELRTMRTKLQLKLGVARTSRKRRVDADRAKPSKRELSLTDERRN